MAKEMSEDHVRLLWAAVFYLLALAAQISGYTNVWVAVGLAGFATLFAFVPCWHQASRWHRQRLSRGKRSLEPSHLIWAGAVGAIISIAMMLGGVVWQEYSGPPPAQTAQNTQQKTFTTLGIGTALLPHRETIQWNEIFGTTRAVDLMFALFLDGTGPEDRSIRLQDAFIESASHGDVIHMQVVGTDNPLDEPFPIAGNYSRREGWSRAGCLGRG
jgi:hypothetical protein